MNPSLKALVLDFDGVVVDSMPPQEEAWRQALQTVPAVEAVTDRLIRNLHAGRAGEEMFSGLVLSESQRAELRRGKDELWFKQRDSVPMAPGATEAIRELAGLMPIGIATTAPADYVRGVLARESLEEVIDAVLTNGDVRHPKPHPEMLERLLSAHLDARPEEALVVGDTIADVAMSLAAGVPMIMMRLGPAKESTDPEEGPEVVRSWSELLSHLHERYHLPLGASHGR